jgi:hypothetical protein
MESDAQAKDGAESRALTLPPPARLLPPAPIGADARAVRAWFDDAVETTEPQMDGSLGAERAAAQAYQASDGASPDNPGHGTLGNGANGQ